MTASLQAQKIKPSSSHARRLAKNAVSLSTVPPIVHEVLHSPGQPLDANARTLMETRLGHNFENVQVHADARAAESARAVNALAYTVGRDVVFNSGQYAPMTSAGQRLITHESTHTLQQRDGSSTDLQIGEPGNSFEHEATRVSDAVLSNAPLSISTGGANTMLARQPENTQMDQPVEAKMGPELETKQREVLVIKVMCFIQQRFAPKDLRPG